LSAHHAAKGIIMSEDLARRIRANQQTLTANFKQRYDFIICGSGSSGSVVARRLAENGAAGALLLEAGGSDEVANIMDATAWPTLRGGDQDWAFKSGPSRRLSASAMAGASPSFGPMSILVG
jgi:choline dehydrogenase